jgi:predicted amidohydrolase YtcJ
VSSSSDAPVTFPSWLQGVMAAMRREGKFGGVAGEAERITFGEALHTYTSTPAWQDRAECDKGQVAPGYVGDLVVLDADLRDVDSKDYVSVPIDATVFAGEVVYDRKATATAAHARAIPARVGGHDDHGVRCYQGGACCCVLTERLLSGQP